MGAIINNVEFIIQMSKELMRNHQDKLFAWVFTREQTNKLHNWLYPSGKVYREFEKREKKRLREFRFL